MSSLAFDHSICEPVARVLDIGCGERKMAGAIGMDIRALSDVDVLHDLNRFPYPFPDDSFVAIHANHVLEHVPDLVTVMGELWRICAPGARVYIRVPHYTGKLAWRDPTHVRTFTADSFGYFGQNEYSFYTPARFKVESARLVYRADNLPLPQRIKLVRRLVQSLFDRHPTYGERNVAYLVGGIDEVRFILRADKS